MSALIFSAADKQIMDAKFASVFSAQPERYFSAPGRTEISGNHTDHQRGRGLAGAVNLDTSSFHELTDDEKIDIVAARVLKKFKPAFEELAK